LARSTTAFEGKRVMSGARYQDGAEKRRHPRYTISKPARLIVNGRYLHGRLKDVSLGGAALKLRAKLSIGDEVEVDIGDIGTYRAVVVRLEEEEGIIATRFLLDAATEARLSDEITKVFHGVPG
jgi:hypothetical protein